MPDVTSWWFFLGIGSGDTKRPRLNKPYTLQQHTTRHSAVSHLRVATQPCVSSGLVAVHCHDYLCQQQVPANSGLPGNDSIAM